MWLREAALHLDKADEDIAEHVEPVLKEVAHNIQVRPDAHLLRENDAEQSGASCRSP